MKMTMFKGLNNVLKENDKSDRIGALDFEVKYGDSL